jgi:hypothetical protein
MSAYAPRAALKRTFAIGSEGPILLQNYFEHPGAKD